MSRTRLLLSTALTGVLLLIVAGPAFAGPVPLEEAGTSGGGTTAVPSSAGTSVWTYIGYAATALLVIALIAVVSMALARHAHRQAPHPA